MTNGLVARKEIFSARGIRVQERTSINITVESVVYKDFDYLDAAVVLLLHQIPTQRTPEIGSRLSVAPLGCNVVRAVH